MSFQQRKHHIIDNLAHNKNDLSPIGQPDAPIIHLLNLINTHSDYVTLSSCSGRLSVFQCKLNSVKGGRWLVCQHNAFEDIDNELEALYNKLQDAAFELQQHNNSNDSKSKNRDSEIYGEIQYKFEPVILHVACNTTNSAQQLLNIALQCGMRNSGIVINNTVDSDNNTVERYTVQIRCSLKIEQVIIDSTGTMYVDKQYLRFMMQQVNHKFILNQQRIDNLYHGILSKLFNNELPKQLQTIQIEEQKEFVTNTDTHKQVNKQHTNHSDIIDLTNDSNTVPVLCCTVTGAPRIQKACKKHNFNNIKRKISPVPTSILTAQQLAVSSDWLALPMTPIAAQQLQHTDNMIQVLQLNDIVQQNELMFTYIASDIVPLKQSKQTVEHTTVTNKPSLLQHTMEQFIHKYNLSTDLIKLLNKQKLKWEQLGDCALLSNTFFNTTEWQHTLTQLTTQQQTELYTLIATVLNVKRIAIQQPIVNQDIKRHSQVVMLLGNSSVVTHKENGILYTFDLCNAMFSSGNGTEKMRQVQLCSTTTATYSEIIVDLYAGIGYFTLPILKYANNVKHLHACEINDVSVQYLQRNMNDNNIDTTRYTLYAGDNRCNKQLQHNVYNTADRILLGLLPTSNDGWPIALQCLKPTGGYMHVHANVVVGLQQQYADDMIQQLNELVHTISDLHRDKRDWQFVVEHIEVVKNYAPRVVHVVIDVKVGHNIIVQTPFVQPVPNKLLPTNSDTIATYSNPTHDQFWHTIFTKHTPSILTDIDIGTCTTEWIVNKLLALHSEQIVSVHICPEQHMRFKPKNYTYKTMTFQEMLLRMLHDTSVHDKYYIAQNERLYMRAVGENIRKETANIYQSFPQLAQNFTVPKVLTDVHQFSSVLRISSPQTTLWIHYDICDNMLIQVIGSKTVTLFPPSQINNLYIDTAVDSSTSPITDIYNYDKHQYPLFEIAMQNSITIQLHAGQCLFIPALWSHSVTSDDNISIAVNIFWKQLDSSMYQNKDLYGNKDLVYGANVITTMHKVNELLHQLPVEGEYRQFYRLRALNILNNNTIL